MGTKTHNLPRIDAASFAGSAKAAGVPALVPGKYPRAHPIEVFGREDGSVDFAFVFNGKWHLLPQSVCEHAAVEVGIQAGAFVSQINYASAVALFLTALEKHKWTVVAPKDSDPILDTLNRDARSIAVPK